MAKYFNGIPARRDVVRASLAEIERVFRLEGILNPGESLHIYQIDAWGISTSADSHDGGWCVDWALPDRSLASMRAQWIMRNAGWLDHKRGTMSPPHHHAIARSPRTSPAFTRWQVSETDAGRDALPGRGPDLGPRNYKRRTVAEGIKWLRRNWPDEQPAHRAGVVGVI